MGDFFKPWRRKFGAATLAMGLVFGAGWFRSHVFLDELVLPNTKETTWSLASFEGGFGISRVDEVSPSTLIPGPNWWTYGSQPSRTIEEQFQSFGATDIFLSEWH